MHRIAPLRTIVVLCFLGFGPSLEASTPQEKSRTVIRQQFRYDPSIRKQYLEQKALETEPGVVQLPAFLVKESKEEKAEHELRGLGGILAFRYEKGSLADKAGVNGSSGSKDSAATTSSLKYRDLMYSKFDPAEKNTQVRLNLFNLRR